MPHWMVAGFWGWVSGSALLLGALVGWFVRLPTRIVAFVMAFGSGVLISALSFELMDEAQRRGGLLAAGGGFLAGAAIFTVANWILSRRGAKHRKRSNKQPSEAEHAGSGLAIALGALLDGIPESIVIGTTMLAGGKVSMVAVIAIFVSNLPEGLSSSVGMKNGKRSLPYVLGLWTAIAVISGVASIVGYVAFGGVGPAAGASSPAIAAGAMLAMLIDTMIPEAFEDAHVVAGFVAVFGFLCAFTLSKLEESHTDDAPKHAQAPR